MKSRHFKSYLHQSSLLMSTNMLVVKHMCTQRQDDEYGRVYHLVQIENSLFILRVVDMIGPTTCAIYLKDIWTHSFLFFLFYQEYVDGWIMSSSELPLLTETTYIIIIIHLCYGLNNYYSLRYIFPFYILSRD